MRTMNTMPIEKHQLPNVHPPERAHEVKRRPLLSVVTPAYNEAKQSAGALRAALRCSRFGRCRLGVDCCRRSLWRSEPLRPLAKLPVGTREFMPFALRRNFGSHMATTCGLLMPRVDCAVIMAADLQDPPEALRNLLTKWLADAQVVWAVRGRREGEKATTIGYSRLYHMLMRHIVGLKEYASYWRRLLPCGPLCSRCLSPIQRE